MKHSNGGALAGILTVVWSLLLLAGCAYAPAYPLLASETSAPGSSPAILGATYTVTPAPAETPSPPAAQITKEVSSPQSSPTVQETAQATAWPSPTTPCYQADFVKDVSITDGTRFDPGQIIFKEWRVRNSGSCAWTSGVHLVFLAGDPLSGPDSLALMLFQPGVHLESRLDEPLWEQARLYKLAPGEEADLVAFFRAPDTEGEYRSLWQITSPEGQPMGQVYLFIRVRGDKEFSILDWSGVWRHMQPAAWAGEQLLVLAQSGVVLRGYYYGTDGVPHLIEAVVSLDGDQVEGAVGEPWTDGLTFYLERLASGYQFHGRILESPFAQSAWCAARGSAAVPVERCLFAP